MKTKRSSKVEEPSEESLREIPPVDFSKTVRFGRGPEALQMALTWARSKRGRPRKGERASGTATKTIRLPKEAWKKLAELAKKQGTTVHALIREAISAKLGRAA